MFTIIGQFKFVRMLNNVCMWFIVLEPPPTREIGRVITQNAVRPRHSLVIFYFRSLGISYAIFCGWKQINMLNSLSTEDFYFSSNSFGVKYKADIDTVAN